MPYSSFAGLAGGVSASLIPSVCRIGQDLADLAGFLALFEVDDKPQAGAGGQRQILLRDAQLLPGFPDDLAEVLWRIFHRRTIDVTVREHYRHFGQKSINYYRTGILRGLQSISRQIFPFGNKYTKFTIGAGSLVY